jgi:hypothetical protein
MARFIGRSTTRSTKEYPCAEDNRWGAIGGELYLADGEDCLRRSKRAKARPTQNICRNIFGRRSDFGGVFYLSRKPPLAEEFGEAAP